MDDTYLWLKSLHIIAVISWMCGMLYLPRLFVYHSQVKVGSEASELFKVMERKLMRLIINPAMIAAWIFGLWLAIRINAFAPENGGWLHAKLGLVLLLQISHAMMSRYRKAFFRDERPKSQKYFRIFNEVPAVLMVVIVILVVVRPF
ncbi:MAG: protoporphyrinogen oxidase HemJ [Alphaproteobacteria bacterium]|nr:protoporphyrinogen oxidase HemJ [Alphaproteobacteria bacterium]